MATQDQTPKLTKLDT